MKALTIWQPCASLIMAGAKPYEYRRWAAWPRLIGETIVIHASAMGYQPGDIEQLRALLSPGATHNPGLDLAIAGPIIRRACYEFDLGIRASMELPRAAGLGTAVLGRPVRCTDLYPDDPEIDPAMWAWPLTDITPWPKPIKATGHQGFWNWPEFAKPQF
jgi:hypothetical protein